MGKFIFESIELIRPGFVEQGVKENDTVQIMGESCRVVIDFTSCGNTLTISNDELKKRIVKKIGGEI